MKKVIISIIYFLIIFQTNSNAEKITFAGIELNLLSDTYDQQIETTKTEEQQEWNYEIIKSTNTYKLIHDPEEVIIAVIDSGFNYDHPYIDKTKIYESIDFTNKENIKKDKTKDPLGHGTNNIEIITKINPLAKILPIHVVDNDGQTDMYQTAKAIKEIIKFNENTENKTKIKVINLSLGSTTYVQSYERTVKKAVDNGIIIISAVGNGGRKESTRYDINYPAGYEDVIGVGSINEQSKKSDFSQINETVFVVAPGEEIETFNGSTMGTSISTAHVTALAGLISSINPETTQEQFKQILITTSEDLGQKEYDKEYGYGLININKAINFAIKQKQEYSRKMFLQYIQKLLTKIM